MIAFANSWLSGFVSSPVSLSMTASRTPLTLKATTGFAVACASSSAMPCPSWVDGRTKTSAQLYRVGSVFSLTSTMKLKLFVRFSFSICCLRVFLRGPFPAITNRVWLCSFVMCLAASIRYGRPFLGISLPTNRMQSLLFIPIWCLMFWLLFEGLNFWVSTPLGTIFIFVLSMP